MVDNWKIAVGEVPLSALGPLDETLLKGKEITHSFLALIDENNQVVEELHGRPLDGFASAFKSLGNSIRQYFNLASAPIDDVIKTKNGAKLKVFINAPADSNPNAKCILTTVKTGEKQDIEGDWQKAIERAIDISSADIDYLAVGIAGRPGQNCHSVTCSILHHIGENATAIAACMTEHYIRPGFDRILPRRSNSDDKSRLPLKKLKEALLKTTQKKGEESFIPKIKSAVKAIKLN